MKKIILLGRRGMAGHMIFNYLSSLGKYRIISTDRHRKGLSKDLLHFDANIPEHIRGIIKTHKPDIIINCIGVLIKESEENPDRAILINSYLPRLIAKYSKQYNFRLIQLSTDCVFSGKKGNYREHDFRDADTVYGRTKAMGEIDNDHNLTIRTSIIGPEIRGKGTGIFHWFFREQGRIQGYSKVFWTGVTTLELAKGIDYLIDKNITGIIHFVPDYKISKYDLLKLTSKIFGKKIDIIKDSKEKSDKSLTKSEKLRITLPSYNAMLTDLKEWIINHKDTYPNDIYKFVKNHQSID